MKNFPKINIVVLNYNGKDCIESCLKSLFCLNYPRFEVVVVDNNSTDGSLEMARRKFPKVTYIKNEENLGFSAGNNIGIKYSLEKMADFVLILNNDTEVEVNLLNKLVERMQSDSRVGIACPVILSSNSDKVWFSGGKIDWLRMKATHVAGSLDFVSGCSMLVRSGVFKKIGLFDEDFFLYWEDVDFSVRARKAGFINSIVHSCFVRHFEKSENNRKNKTYWLVLSGLIFFKKNASNWTKLWLWFYLTLRKAKNRYDLYKNKKDEIALIVQKAYQDFNKFECRK